MSWYERYINWIKDTPFSHFVIASVVLTVIGFAITHPIGLVFCAAGGYAAGLALGKYFTGDL